MVTPVLFGGVIASAIGARPDQSPGCGTWSRLRDQAGGFSPGEAKVELLGRHAQRPFRES
jgi:hypothetical protein